MQALVYTRVSADRAGGRSPREQEAEARAVCEREGWTVAHVLTDSIGASRHSKGTRGAWANAQKLIASRLIDVLVTWESSRAQRDLAAYAELRALCAEHRVLWSYKGRTHDLTRTDDRFTTALDALLAEREADETSDRVRRAMRASAAQGRPPGRRLFGYQRDYDATTGRLTGQHPHPTEAQVVRDMFAWHEDGLGSRTIARRLNDAGITTGTGVRWADSGVVRVLRNPAYVARRVHRGQVVGAGDWPALISEDTFERTQARLSSTPRTMTTGTPRLLTSVGRCGKCGGKMVCIHDRNRRKVYACGQGYCVARDMRKLDAHVSAVMIERLSRPDAQDAIASSGDAFDAVSPLHQERVHLTERLDDAVGAFTRGELSAVTLGKIELDLRGRLTDLDRQLRSRLMPKSIELPEGNLAAWWHDTLDAAARRLMVGAWLDAVVVHPTVRGTRQLDRSAVEILFRR